jgi:hypothetical protein
VKPVAAHEPWFFTVTWIVELMFFTGLVGVTLIPVIVRSAQFSAACVARGLVAMNKTSIAATGSTISKRLLSDWLTVSSCPSS